MMMRLPMGAALLALAAIDLADHASHPALPIAGIVVGVLLIATLLLDVLMPGTTHGAS